MFSTYPQESCLLVNKVILLDANDFHVRDIIFRWDINVPKYDIKKAGRGRGGKMLKGLTLTSTFLIL